MQFYLCVLVILCTVMYGVIKNLGDLHLTRMSKISRINLSLYSIYNYRSVLIETAKKLGLKCHEQGTTVTIEGPRFSSKAESMMFRGWGCDVVNMTTVPEVCLAKEAGICYASIGLPTDYDSWKDEPVSKGLIND